VLVDHLDLPHREAPTCVRDWPLAVEAPVGADRVPESHRVHEIPGETDQADRRGYGHIHRAQATDDRRQQSPGNDDLPEVARAGVLDVRVQRVVVA
jgi:hypothetical protein